MTPMAPGSTIPLPTAVPALGAADPGEVEMLIRRLDGIADVDPRSALRHVGGRPAALIRVLHLFIRTYGAGLPALLDIDGAEADGFAAWRATCHSVRGALDTIGASRLAADLMRLEESLLPPSTRAQHLAAARAIHRQIEKLSRDLERAIA